MKRLLIFSFLILFLFAIKVSADEKTTEEDVEQYTKKNGVSCYRDSWSSCTLAYCGDGYYNEKGEFIPPEPCNTCEYSYICSDGKVFELRYYTN